MVVRRLVRDLAFDTEIVVLPTVREDSGLAYSSRNAYLETDDRRAAAVLFRALSHAESAYSEGERSARKLAEIIRVDIGREPRAEVEYVAINDADTLEKLDRLDDRPVLISLAVRFGKTRLIDNIILNRTRTGKTGALVLP
jgi:pantoate--beta-alanine ligase